ncbi:MAG: hypothetical protein AABX54_05275 [Nanoarchaeota archaeon]
MTTNKFSGLEPQFLCDVCSIAVTNPICPACLAEEIEAWATLYPNLRKELLPKLHYYLQKIEDKLIDSTECIKCGNKRAAVCPFCFTEHVLKELKRIKANRIILKEFVDFFNFDFEHNGYSQEAERLGVI